MSREAVAGIGVGTAIIGALISSSIFIFFGYRNRRRRHSRRQGKSPAIDNISAAGGTTFADLDGLPQPIAHEELKQSFTAVETDIDNYINNFFDHRRPAKATLDNQALTALVGYPGVDNKSQWSQLLTDPDTRALALKSFIARVLFARIDPDGDPHTTLLPAGVVSTYRSMIPSQRGTQDLFRATHRNIWRTLTAHLVLTAYPDERLRSGDPRLDSIKATTADILQLLHPFGNDKAQDRSSVVLQKVVTRAALFGWKLFAQTTPGEFLWLSKSEHLVSFPGLVLKKATSDAEEAGGIVISPPSVV